MVGDHIKPTQSQCNIWFTTVCLPQVSPEIHLLTIMRCRMNSCSETRLARSFLRWFLWVLSSSSLCHTVPTLIFSSHMLPVSNISEKGMGVGPVWQKGPGRGPTGVSAGVISPIWFHYRRAAHQLPRPGFKPKPTDSWVG